MKDKTYRTKSHINSTLKGKDLRETTMVLMGKEIESKFPGCLYLLVISGDDHGTMLSNGTPTDVAVMALSVAKRGIDLGEAGEVPTCKA